VCCASTNTIVGIRSRSKTGDALISLDGYALTEDDVVPKVRALGEGAHRLIVRRHTTELRLKLVVGTASAPVAMAPESPDGVASEGDGSATPKPGPEPTAPGRERSIGKDEPVRVFQSTHVADAQKLRMELEGSGTKLVYNDAASSKIVSDVRHDTLMAGLGFEEGDALQMIGDRSAAQAAKEGQGGSGLLVDGLQGARGQGRGQAQGGRARAALAVPVRLEDSLFGEGEPAPLIQSAWLPSSVVRGPVSARAARPTWPRWRVVTRGRA